MEELFNGFITVDISLKGIGSSLFTQGGQRQAIYAIYTINEDKDTKAILLSINSYKVPQFSHTLEHLIHLVHLKYNKLNRYARSYFSVCHVGTTFEKERSDEVADYNVFFKSSSLSISPQGYRIALWLFLWNYLSICREVGKALSEEESQYNKILAGIEP